MLISAASTRNQALLYFTILAIVSKHVNIGHNNIKTEKYLLKTHSSSRHSLFIIMLFVISFRCASIYACIGINQMIRNDLKYILEFSKWHRFPIKKFQVVWPKSYLASFSRLQQKILKTNILNVVCISNKSLSKFLIYFNWLISLQKKSW